jgi:hypothetical protein
MNWIFILNSLVHLFAYFVDLSLSCSGLNGSKPNIEDKLWLQAQIDKQIKSAALDGVDLAPAAEDWSDEDWNNEDWTKLSLQGLIRAYGDDEPDYELLETKEFHA